MGTLRVWGHVCLGVVWSEICLVAPGVGTADS
jgi:hypothetical protein